MISTKTIYRKLLCRQHSQSDGITDQSESDSRKKAVANLRVLALIPPLLVLTITCVYILYVATSSRSFTKNDILFYVSAATSIVSLFSIVTATASLLIQRKEQKIQRESAMRNTHVELQRIALDDESLLAVWGDYAGTQEVEGKRQHIYLNLIISQWQMGFEAGAIGLNQIEVMSDSLLQTIPARRYWYHARISRRSFSMSRKTRILYDTLDIAFDKHGGYSKENGEADTTIVN